MHKRLFAAVVLLLLVLISASEAQVPRSLSYQGVLTDSTGRPKPDGSYSFTFRLYPSASGGAALWAEIKTLLVSRGLFSTVLGDQVPVDLSFDVPYWLSIQVAADPELSPRIPFTSVGYSIHSLRADTAQYARTAPQQSVVDSARVAGSIPNNIVTTSKIADGAVTAAKISTAQVVKSLNGVRDAVTFRAQGGATITSSGDTITINAGTGGGGVGVQSIQNTNNTLDVINPTGPTVTVNVKSQGIGTTQLADNAVTSAKIPTGQVVKSLNTLRDDVTLLAGSNVTITPGASSLTIAASSGLSLPFSATASSSNPLFSLTNTGTAGNSIGLFGQTNSAAFPAAGVRGNSVANGSAVGVYGDASSNTDGIGVYGTGGVYGGSFSGGVYGVFGSGTSAGVRGVISSTTFLASGVRGEATASSGQTIGVEGVSTASPIGTGVTGRGSATGGYFTASNGTAVVGYGNTGAYFETSSSTGFGVHGRNSTGGVGVYGEATGANGFGLYGVANAGIGTYGSGSIYGVYGASNTGQAGHFVGNVNVAGNLSKTTGSFKIDHPLDPANKYLYHSFVESPDMMNIYNGNVVLDANGEAEIELPPWFSALNKDFRYQLTPIGSPGPNLYVSKEIQETRFSIAGGKSGMKVSWQVTGIRQDVYAEKHRIPVEQNKPSNERGLYLHPEVYNQPAEKSIDWALKPKATEKANEEREKHLETLPKPSR